MPERFTEEEVREMQGFSDGLVLTAMGIHQEVEENLGPVAVYDEEGTPTYPLYMVETYLSIMGEAIETEDMDTIETAFTIVLASLAAIKGITSIDMKKSIIANGDEIIED